MPSQSLLPYNTFGIDETAARFFRLVKPEDLKIFSEGNYPKPWRMLGGGSNILLTGPVDGTVIKNELKGIELTDGGAAYMLVRAAAGESWHGLVEFALAHNLGGIENLALIPGTVGASPIQNIGAYGTEIKEVVHAVEFYRWDTRKTEIFTAKDCAFGYRDSVFKHTLAGAGVITGVTYRLSKQPEVRTGYGAIAQELVNRGIQNPTIQDVAASVISIRKSKLPDPAVTGNAGSFFKNPTVDNATATSLKERFTDMPAYPAATGKTKLAAGWMIEQCGWKGKSSGPAGVHHQQALVLINKGGATGKDVLALAAAIQQSVQAMFGLMLEMEVQRW